MPSWWDRAMAGAMAGRWLHLRHERPRLSERRWCHGAQSLLHSQLQASWDVCGAVDMDPFIWAGASF